MATSYIRIKNKKMLRKISETLQLFIATVIIFFGGFLMIEGAVVRAVDTKMTNFNVSLSITDEVTIACSPASSTYPVSIGSLAGITGGTATSSVDQFNCTITSVDSSGWSLYVHATNTPAMSKLTSGTADTVADFPTTNSYNFSPQVAAGEAKFGFAASTTIANDLVLAFRNNGSACGGAGTSNENTHCWSGLNGNTGILVVDTTHAATAGQVVKFTFKVKSGSSRNLTSGTYNAHINITALDK